jgi:hypothetical protein
VKGVKLQLKGLLGRVSKGELSKADALAQADAVVKKYLESTKEVSRKELQAQTGVMLETLPPEVESKLSEFHGETMRAFALVLNSALKPLQADWVTLGSGHHIFMDDDATALKPGDRFEFGGLKRPGTIVGRLKESEAFPGSNGTRMGYKVKFDDTEYPYEETEGIGAPGTGRKVEWNWIPGGAARPKVDEKKSRD